MPNLPYISPDLVKSYQDAVAQSSSPATAKRKAISLNRFFDWAETQGYIESNPLVKTTPPIQFQVQKPVRHIGTRTFATIGITAGVLVIVFLLTWKLKFPIPFITTPAQETINTVSSVTQTPGIIPAATAVNLAWNLFAKMKITDTSGQPVTGAQTLSFKLFNTQTGGSALYSSEPVSVTTDENGSTLISLDKVPGDLFFQNNQLYLEPQIGSSSSTLRIPVSTANTAANLGGYFPANPNTGAGPNEVPVISSDGALALAGESPAIKAKEGNLLVEGQAVTIKAADGSGGNIEINPDANGYTHFLFEGAKGNLMNAQAPNLTSGSLYYGMVPNNSTGYYLVNLQSGSKLTTKFSVDAQGNTNMTGGLSTNGTERLTSTGALKNITGYSQTSGNFTVSQNPGDYASITKNGTALSDVLNLSLNEEGIPGSHYSTLVLNRYGGDANARALLVNSGNAQFNGQLQLGNYSSNPISIGTGSLVYNTTDNTPYFWNGSTWISVGTASTTPFSGILSGTNTTATMIVGSGASLSTSGTGTISATDLTCVGCVSNSELANSAITINSGGILSGGGSVSLGGTLNLTATEADTLNSVTNRGATTINTITVGNLIDSSLTANKGVFTDISKQLTTTGTLGADQGGTGFSTYAVGDILYANTTSSLNKLADVATGNVLISGGVNTAPSWGQVVLGTHTTGNYVSTITGTANQITASASTGDITLSIPSDFRAPGTINAVNGIYTGAIAGIQRIDASGNLVSIGTTQFHGITYTWPAGPIAANNYILQTQTDGTLAWIDPALAAAGSIYWTSGFGSLYPKNNTLDVLIGSDSTASAKFAFTGVNTGGTPTASIAGTIANVAIFIDGNGNISTTNRNNLTLGNSATYDFTGNILLNPKGTGNVGIGKTVPNFTLDIAGNASISATLSLGPMVQGQAGTCDASAAGKEYYDGIQNSFYYCNGSVWTAIGSGSGTSYWGQTLGVLYPLNNSVDLLIGADSTASAKFAFTGVNTGGTPTASIAGTTANVATYLTGEGNLAMTNKAHLTLGGGDTGQVDVANDLNLASGKAYLINGVSVLNNNTLGTGVLTSSLTTVGALNAGSITSGFGAINTGADNIITTGTMGVAANTVFTGLSQTLTGQFTSSYANSAAINLTGNAAGITFTGTGVDQIITAASQNLALMPGGSVGIGTTTPTALLDVAGAASVSGSLTFRTGAGSIQTTAFNPLTIGGDTTGNITLAPSNNINGGSVTPGVNNMTDLGTSSLKWRNVYATTITGTTIYQGVSQVCDASGTVPGCSGASYWDQALGALYPTNNTVDVLFGSNATASAKFAFTGINTGGTPTASIAGTTANVATFVDGNGNISTTNGQNLVLGNSSTYSFTGNILLNPIGLGNVGIGTTSPLFKLSVIGTAANATGRAAFLVDQYENQDILTASASGTPRMALKNDGTLQLFNATSSITNTAGDITIDAFSNFTSFAGDSIGNIATMSANTATLSGSLAFTGVSPATINILNGDRLDFQTSVGGDAGLAAKMTILNNGNVGIGTISPGYLFVVNGSLGSVNFTANGESRFIGTNTTSHFNYGATEDTYIRGGKSASAIHIGDNTSGDIDLAVGGGKVGIGNAGPAYPLDVTGEARVTSNLYAQKFIDTTSSPTYYLDPAGATSLYIAGGITSDNATQFNIASVANKNIVINAGAGTVVIGNGTGKLDAGTIDPPYTIDGEKYATYLPSMTGVKEETTGNLTTTEYVPGVGYRSVIDFTQALTGSDLWLFSKVTNLTENLDKMVVLLSPATNTKSWYSFDSPGKLFIYTGRPTSVSYRLTAPRFDSTNWNNSRVSENSGFIVPSLTNWPISVNLNNSGDVQLGNLAIVPAINSSSEDVKYSLADTIAGQLIEEVASYSQAVIANIRSGFIVAKEIATNSFTAFQGTIDNLLITNGLVAGSIQTKLISPLPDGTDVTVQIGSGTESGKFAINNGQGTEVASIDSTGNATFSGTLYADQVKSKSLDEIQAVLTQVQTDQQLLSQVSGWNINTATNSASVNTLAVSDLYVTNQAAVNSLSVTNTLTVGSLVFQSAINGQQSTIDSSINTLSAPLKIQSLAMAPVEIMAGLVTIDTQGNVNIAGDLYVAGRIKSSGLTLSAIDNQESATGSALFTLQNQTGTEVASVNASGSAQFGSVSTPQLVIAGADATESGTIVDGVITTNSTVGKAVVPVGVSQITIKNQKVTDYTLVYVTPTSSTQNYVLYVKSKQAGQFVVGFDSPLHPAIDVNFNWWIVQVAQ